MGRAGSGVVLTGDDARRPAAVPSLDFAPLCPPPDSGVGARVGRLLLENKAAVVRAIWELLQLLERIAQPRANQKGRTTGRFLQTHLTSEVSTCLILSSFPQFLRFPPLPHGLAKKSRKNLKR